MALTDRGKELYEIGKERWFQPEEIFDLLVNYLELGFELCQTRITNPVAGTFYLFHRLQVPDFKSDEIEWEKKKSSQTVNEQYLKLLIKGVHVITGLYATSSADACFRRRTYRLADQQNSVIQLVHYRNCEGDAYVRKVRKNSISKQEKPSEPELSDSLPISISQNFGNSFDSPHLHSQIFDSNSYDIIGAGGYANGFFSPGDDQMDEVDYQDFLYLVNQSSEERTNENNNHISPPAVPAQSATAHFSTLKILDFVPTKGSSLGGEKMLLCFAQDIPVSFDSSLIQVIFSPVGSQTQDVPSMTASAEILTRTVIRLLTPPLLTSSHLRYVLMVCTLQGVMISLPSGMEFTFLDPAPPLLPDSASLSSSPISASATAVTRPRKRDPSTLEPTPQDAPFSSSDPNLTNPSSNDYSRIHKIRIVEKLLTTHNSLPSPNHHPLLFNPNDPSPSFSISEDDWLDDKSLSLLSSSDLEKLMDRYLYNVVNQLVQLAISDDDLKAELDHLDSSGYSLLHYCCLFNLTSLVEILLSKGASIDLMTGSGSTALHLAADAGHYFIVQHLVSAGADISLRDCHGLTPAESALSTGQPSLPSYWHLLSSSEFPSSSFQTNPCPSQRSKESPQFKQSKVFSFDSSTVTTSADPLSFFGTQDLVSEDEDSFVETNACSFSSVKESALSPPMSRRSSSAGLELESSGTAHTPTAMTLLQEAVSSLSLADKCALSLSLGNSRMQSPNDFESVLSEYDKESLDVAMSMMGPTELSQVEDEVRIIQNGVRTWLLRKNYINLRDAARTLQVAWRGRKGDRPPTHSSHHLRRPPMKTELETINECHKDSVDFQQLQPLLPEAMGMRMEMTQDRGHGHAHSLGSGSGEATGTRISNEKAAATLQAATRGMLARKEFHHIKRQTMASLVIQKSLLQWWGQQRGLPMSASGFS